MTVTAQRARLSRSTSTSLLAVGVLPFAIGTVLHVDGGHLHEVAIPCPFREATGLPCPLCGSVRAVVLASHLNGSLWSYNAVMVVVLLALAALGLAGLIAERRGRALRLPSTRVLIAVGAVVLGVAWTWTLLHHRTIVG